MRGFGGGRGQGRGRGTGDRGYGGSLSPRAYRAYRQGVGSTREDLRCRDEIPQAPVAGPAPLRGRSEPPAPPAKAFPALMAVVARSDDCVLCGVCADACPSYAIAVADKVTIDTKLCTACGVCVNICPNEALEMSER